MDFLRSCNATKSRVVEGSNVLYWLRWFRAAPEAAAFPNWHAFGHPAWEPERNDFTGPGCFYHGLEWCSNKFPAPPGNHFEGLPQWFRYGLPADDLAVEPISNVCHVPAVDALGGVELDGTGWPLIVTSGPCLCASPITATSIPQHIVSAPCLCATPLTVIQMHPIINMTACLCATPATAHITEAVGFSKPCLCATPLTGVATGITRVSNPCLCATPATLHVVGVSAMSNPCLCATPATASAAGVSENSNPCLCATPATAQGVGVSAFSNPCLCATPITSVEADRMILWDQFNAPNGTPLAAHTPNIGGPWGVKFGAPTIIANACQEGAAVVDTFHADVIVQADITIGDNLNADWGIWARYGGSGQLGYQLVVRAGVAPHLALYRDDSVPLGIVPTSYVNGQTIHLKLTLSGSSLIGTDGTNTITFTDSTYNTKTAHGFDLSTTNPWTVDNMLVTARF